LHPIVSRAQDVNVVSAVATRHVQQHALSCPCSAYVDAAAVDAAEHEDDEICSHVAADVSLEMSCRPLLRRSHICRHFLAASRFCSRPCVLPVRRAPLLHLTLVGLFAPTVAPFS